MLTTATSKDATRRELTMVMQIGAWNTTRVVNGLRRRKDDLMLRWHWRTHPDLAAEHRRRMLEFRDCHAGRRCFVIGNGPSLTKTDLSKLAGEITLGANRIHLIEADTRFRPTYLAAIDDELLRQFGDEIVSQPGPKFISWQYARRFGMTPDVTLLRLNYARKFETDLTRPIWGGHTVTFVNLQLAFYMGCTEVYLIGVDHRYSATGVPNTEVVAGDNDGNHFARNYYAPGHRYRVPDYVNMERAYGLAKSRFERAGRLIHDATIGGRLQVFDKVDYEMLF